VTTRDTYTFKIDGVKPDTLPMARLAEYLAELANLMGERERVHFAKLTRGSVVVTANVERQAAPKVRKRVVQAKKVAAAEDIKRPFERLNQLLRDDNARADLTVGTAKILKFPGADARLDERIGPFTEARDVDGVLVRIGGTDDTAHAGIQDADGFTWPFIVTREKARALAQYLYGAPIRVSGSGRWVRTELGKWELQGYLRLVDFRVLRDDDLSAVVARLRSIEGSQWSREKDPLARLANVRDGDEGVH
jgi:hypothetical protein